MTQKHLENIGFNFFDSEQKVIGLPTENPSKSIKKVTVAIQTEENSPELFFNISKNKNVHLYYSKTYKDFVLSFNFSNCKKYIITKDMWKFFKFHYSKIDQEMSNKI